MNDFALVTEGVSDHAVLKNILIGFFGNQRRPDITFEWPNPVAVEKYGGWTLVLQYLRDKKYRETLQANRFVVVQIDTDVAEEPGFDVPKQGSNGTLSVEELVGNVVKRLQKEIGDEDWETYGESFIFAVGVEQTECWVLPLWFNDNRAEQTANCLDRLGKCPQLRDALDAKNLPWISAKRKEPLSYDLASRGLRKRDILLDRGASNPSLRIFLNELLARTIVLQPIEE